MKKVFLGSLMAAIGVIVAFNLSLVFDSGNNHTLNLENVEAKAAWEWGDGDDDEMELVTRYCSDYISTHLSCETSFSGSGCDYRDETNCTNDDNGNGSGGNNGGNNPVFTEVCRVSSAHICEYLGYDGKYYKYYCRQCRGNISSTGRLH